MKILHIFSILILVATLASCEWTAQDIEENTNATIDTVQEAGDSAWNAIGDAAWAVEDAVDFDEVWDGQSDEVNDPADEDFIPFNDENNPDNTQYEDTDDV